MTISGVEQPTELVLARHGEARCNRDQIVGGFRGCGDLTDRGHQQARLLAHRLRRDTALTGELGGDFHALYTSPLPRARNTAGHLAGALALSATVVDDLREQHPGDADGHNWTNVIDTFVARHGDAPAARPDQPLGDGGESWNDHLQRVVTILRRLLNEHRGQRLLIVAHGGTIAAAHHLLLDLPSSISTQASFAAHQAAETHWSQQPVRATRPDGRYRWTLIRHNDTSHLAVPENK